MTMTKSLAVMALGCCAAATTVNAATIYLMPATQTLAVGTTAATFDLMMNFSAAELTVGGGIDVDVSGAGSFASFTPSTYFTTVPDPAFTGHGTQNADNDYQIHFGSFSGLSGLNNLGRLALNLSGAGGTTTTISLAANRFFGGFFSATSPAPLDVTMTGGSVGISGVVIPVIPEPQVAWLLLGGLGAVGFAARRRLTAA